MTEVRLAVLTALFGLCPLAVHGITITVNSTADTVTADGSSTLREAT